MTTVGEANSAYPNQPSWLERPARRQVDEKTFQQEQARKTATGERNIWNGRVLQSGPRDGDQGGRRSKQPSRFRCVPLLDVGYTRGSQAGQRTFCSYFAKGCCAAGSTCTYLHRLPTLSDEEYSAKDMGADCFGREKLAEHERFHGKAGTMERDNRTLYINYEGAGAYDVPAVRKLLEDSFRVWGIVDSIYIVHNKTIAFVRYEWRTSAEFAKEAMHRQSLTGSTLKEVLTVRWSNEDPNPASMVVQQRAFEERFADAYWGTWETLPPEEKKRRVQALQLQVALKRGRAIAEYPNTDDQYATASAHSAGAAVEAYPNTDDQYAMAGGQGDAVDEYPNTDAQYACTPNSGAGGVAGGTTSAQGLGSRYEEGDAPTQGSEQGIAVEYPAAINLADENAGTSVAYGEPTGYGAYASEWAAYYAAQHQVQLQQGMWGNADSAPEHSGHGGKRVAYGMPEGQGEHPQAWQGVASEVEERVQGGEARSQAQWHAAGSAAEASRADTQAGKGSATGAAGAADDSDKAEAVGALALLGGYGSDSDT